MVMSPIPIGMYGIFAYIYRKTSSKYVGKDTIYMDPMGMGSNPQKLQLLGCPRKLVNG